MIFAPTVSVLWLLFVLCSRWRFEAAILRLLVFEQLFTLGTYYKEESTQKESAKCQQNHTFL